MMSIIIIFIIIIGACTKELRFSAVKMRENKPCTIYCLSIQQTSNVLLMPSPAQVSITTKLDLSFLLGNKIESATSACVRN